MCASAQASVTNLYRVLREQGISFDSGKASARALEAVVRAVDPWGRILEEGEEVAPTVTLDVSGEKFPGGIGYVAVRGMGVGAGLRVGEYLGGWIEDGLRGVILDMRSAQGTDLMSVDLIAGLVSGRTNQLYTVRDGGTNVIERHCGMKTPALPRGLPVVVLLDESTRGCPELLAAVLRGQGSILVGGGRTKGDWGVREILTLDDGRRLYIATRWLVPSCGSYAETGVAPDIVVAGDAVAARDEGPLFGDADGCEGARTAATMAQRVAGDAVLKRAADIVLGMGALYVSDAEADRAGEAP